jgi:hypothetical protein
MVISLIFLLLLGLALNFIVYWSVSQVLGCAILGFDFRRRVGTDGAERTAG